MQDVQFHPGCSRLHSASGWGCGVWTPSPSHTGGSLIDHLQGPVLPGRLCTFRDQLIALFVIPNTHGLAEMAHVPMSIIITLTCSPHGADYRATKSLWPRYRRYNAASLSGDCRRIHAAGVAARCDSSGSRAHWPDQILVYAMHAGVQWVVLTDGDEYRVYNAHAVVPFEEKLFRSVRLSDEGARTEELLELIAKERMRENWIDTLWKAHFVDRQIRA